MKEAMNTIFWCEKGGCMGVGVRGSSLTMYTIVCCIKKNHCCIVFRLITYIVHQTLNIIHAHKYNLILHMWRKIFLQSFKKCICLIEFPNCIYVPCSLIQHSSDITSLHKQYISICMYIKTVVSLQITCSYMKFKIMNMNAIFLNKFYHKRF